MLKLTEKEIEAGKTKKGGFDQIQLAQWGVKWPPRHGWRSALLRGLDPNRPLPPESEAERQERLTRWASFPRIPRSLAQPHSATAFIARFDGGCEPINPGGHGASACLIETDGGEEIYRKSEYLGTGAAMTNNVAEYRGLLLILKWVAKNAAGLRERNRQVHIIGDSQIVIKRMLQSARKKGSGTGICATVAAECLLTAEPLRDLLSFEWQRREHNGECDAMCQMEIEEARFCARGCV